MYSVVGSDGQVYGPVDMATLVQWIRDGRIVATTSLIDPLDGRVLQAHQAPALYDQFNTPTTMAPPMPGPPPMSGMSGPLQPYGAYPRPDLMMQGRYLGPPKSKVAAILLAFFLGSLGIHRFYLGHTGTGIAMLLITVLTCGWGGIITGIWALIDLILIATGGLQEANGRALT